MPIDLRVIRVFIASPSGLEDERKIFREEIDALNEADAVPRGFRFQAIGWEDTLGGVGRPQKTINVGIRTSDYFILLLWNRWGSPPSATESRFSSGTEEEFHLAMDCYNERQTMREVVIMFKAVEPEQLSDPDSQLKKVLDFRKEVEQRKTHLYHVFDSAKNFRALIRKHLAAWLRIEEARRAGKTPSPIAVVDPFVSGGRVFGENTPSAGDAVAVKAWQLAAQGRLTEAEIEFSKNMANVHQPQPRVEYAKFLLRVGRLDQARAALEDGVAIATHQGDGRALAEAYGIIGQIYFERGDWNRAKEQYRSALTTSEQLGDQAGIADGCAALGIVLRSEGELSRAEDMFRKSLGINEKLNRTASAAQDYGNLGNTLFARGDLDGAEKMHRRSLELSTQLGQTAEMALSYGNLGNVLQARGAFDDAERMHRKSLAVHQQLGHLLSSARDYGNLGNAFLARGNLHEAERMYRTSLEINERVRAPEGIAIAFGNLGLVFQKAGDLARAEQMHRASLTLNRQLGRSEGVAAASANVGDVLQAKGDFEGAERMYLQALDIDEQLGHVTDVDGDYANLVNMKLRRRDLDGAELLYRKMLHRNELLGRTREQAIGHLVLGGILQSKGSKEDAKAEYLTAIDLANQINMTELVVTAKSALAALS